MRITQSMMKDQIVNNIDNVLRRISTLQRQASSGNKFDLPSQDPSDAVLTVNYNAVLEKLKTYKSSLQQVQNNFQGYDNITGQIMAAVQQVNSLVVQAANGTNTPSDRAAIADEIKQISKTIAQLGGTNVSGNYMFAGSSNSNPITSMVSGGSTIYYYTSNSATSARLSLNIGTVTLDSNVNVVDLFNYTQTISGATQSASLISYVTGSGGTVHTGLLDKIVKDLQNNNVSDLQSDLGALQDYENSLSKVTTKIGATEQSLQSLMNSNESLNTYVTQLVSSAQGADMVKVLSDLALQETVYQAALQTSANSLLPTLANFLK
ncbi:MAG: hypothetical protein C0176_07765 [Mesoaciditoga sp.]|uniref:flagellin N-terminal helical domain-containing protein n=1 Tax=Athalassotoga sp. TaxID=2022597 RepID=UPI000CBD038B|nr:MAG: hypothetical protein C0185_04095 [Mesoaciditoga sp.]PMP78711.1 MAG: hypothetical protein C0176_07765 [Mesoaciditoga sp.]HEU24294.1 hypothetical protein [Mesoaciditoga lauensis]